MPGLILSPQIKSGQFRQRGAASLVVVMLLFFVVALVSAYTSRNLIFEQRISANQYRSSMAFEAADAGLEWAVGMLAAGRIGADCTEATAAATDTSFRQRYLNADPDTGMVVPRTRSGGVALAPICIWKDDDGDGVGSWDCSCPSNSVAALGAANAQGYSPAFSVRFAELKVPRPGAIRVEVNGCVRPTSATDPCLSDFSGTPVLSEGRAQHTAVLVIKSAITTPPTAALTVIGNVTGGGAATLKNADPASSGITVHAAGAINAASFTISSLPGTPPTASLRPGDDRLIPNGLSLAELLDTPPVPLQWDRVFGSTFGLMPASYRDQPAARRLVCPVAGCRQALSDLVAANPHRVIWVQGDLVLETAGDIGTMPDAANPAATGPAMIVVDGRVRFLTPGVNIFGVVYARNGNWEGSGTITGAAIVEGDLAAAAAPTVVYDASVLKSVQLTSGSFVPLPGGWKDFDWRVGR